MDLTPSPHIRMLDRPLTFDPRGDLTLIVGKAKREYLVDARSLARASDVWAKMLFGPFAESKPKQADAKWTVSLPEDDDSAMLILLDIIHADFASVPEQLSLDELFDVTVLTDKYKLTSRLAPWASRWFRCVQHKSGSDEKLLWIVWELGEETVFRRIAKTFVMSSTINEDGELLLPTGVNPTVSPSPPELLDLILDEAHLQHLKKQKELSGIN
ncbi:hypothetical protein F4780DRAFT_781731 [Xylariomycetidae sp. FL0641]|nr:hypothetical protein F4780DRAFT_781731 [Xylariomycetidae sp. FL0641]